MNTRGPWEIDDSIFKLGYFLMIRNADGELVAETDELEDANLIAAAPELLDALETLVARCENPWTDPTVWDDCDEYAQAVAALAKARGESVDTG